LGPAIRCGTASGGLFTAVTEYDADDSSSPEKLFLRNTVTLKTPGLGGMNS